MEELFLDFFEQIGNFFSSILDLIVHFVADLLYIVGLLGRFLGDLPTYFGWLPSPVLTLLITLFGLTAILVIIGRRS